MKVATFLIACSTLLSACEKKEAAQKPAIEPQVKKYLGIVLAEKGLKLGSPIFLRAFKEEEILEVFVKKESTGVFELFATYSIAAASGELGPKLAEGDKQVPEGVYHVGPKALNPKSSYHLSFNIGYPNAYDRAHKRTGSLIMIHGASISIGCLAMTDEKIEEIYALADEALKGGQPFFRVHMLPFRMTEARMQKAASSPHFPFWKNLKTGHDLFEENRIPPNVEVEGKRYVFQ